MQYNWLNKSNNENLIIFFCGWSFDEKPFERLNCGSFDVLVFYDYKTHDIPIEIPKYKRYYLITWSMGVYIAYLLKDLLPNFDKKFAINGTPFPIDNSLGIPEKTFELTLKHVDVGLQGKFQRNLFKDEKDYEKYLQNPVGRTIEEQSQELVELKNYIVNSAVLYERFYDCAIISDTDKIVPTKNQINCWEKRASIKIIDSGHFPFYSFNSWEDILKCN